MRTLILVATIGWTVITAASAAAQTAPAEPAQPAAAPTPDSASQRSLFEPTWRQLRLGVRISDISGDPARYQRYEDIRDGLLFTDVRYKREWETTGQSVALTADNVGWRDQRFWGEIDRPGRLRATGLWDQIPQFYSVDTSTPYSESGPGVLVLPDGTQSAIQNGQASLSAYVPLAPQFDLRERRDIGMGSITVMPTTNLDLTARFRSDRHVGELPWGASFGFGNDIEVALPYNSRTNMFSVGAEWTNQQQMLRVAYDGSWFDNLDDTLTWDNPLRLTDVSGTSGRGRTALWPSNSAQTVSVGGYARFARRTQLTGFMSYGFWSNDQPLLPFTINSALPQIALPRQTTEAEAFVFSTNLSLVSRPIDDWRFSARWRLYNFNNQNTPSSIPQFVSYDAGVSTSSVGGPELWAHSRDTTSFDATWTGLSPVALAVGYTHNGNGYDFRAIEDSGENVLTLTADAVGNQWTTFRAQYEVAGLDGSAVDVDRLNEIGDHVQLRYYDLANRSRQRFTGQVDIIPQEAWVLSASAGFGKDDYDETDLGLQEATFRIFGFGVDYQRPNGLGAGGSYNYERYSGLQRGRSYGNSTDAQNPLRDWTADSVERVHYFSIYATPPRIGPATEVRVSYDFARAATDYVYGLEPGSPLPPPSQLPEAYNKLQELRAEVRHRLTARLGLTGSYTYEPFRVYDFAMDPSVIDGIVQPSSLVLGYVYRPYTAHSAIVGLIYFW